MITHISIYMRAHDDTHPFVAIERNGHYKFYGLTEASAWRLSRACRSQRGRVYVKGSGWSWTRAGA